MPDYGPESWLATEKPEMYAVERLQPDGTESRRTTEKSAIERESSDAVASQAPSSCFTIYLGRYAKDGSIYKERCCTYSCRLCEEI